MDIFYWLGMGYIKEVCEVNCVLDVGCYGYLYNLNDLRCIKFVKMDYEDNEYCIICIFFSK